MILLKDDIQIDSWGFEIVRFYPVRIGVYHRKLTYSTDLPLNMGIIKRDNQWPG
jgi:hypothetical protein